MISRLAANVGCMARRIHAHGTDTPVACVLVGVQQLHQFAPALQTLHNANWNQEISTWSSMGFAAAGAAALSMPVTAYAAGDEPAEPEVQILGPGAQQQLQ